jgi:hypothetical protein
MKQLKKDDHAYKEKGSCQLLPSDICLLRNHLLSSKSIVSLQTYVIILIAIALFLRHDEFHDIEMCHFVADTFQVHDDQVEALVLKVSSATDYTWVTPTIWANHEFPELCPV